MTNQVKILLQLIQGFKEHSEGIFHLGEMLEFIQFQERL